MGSNDAFELGTMRAGRGEKISGFLDVPAGGDDDATRIPVTVVHGARPGGVLALIAGTHGSEYPPILALQRLRSDIDPAALAGTLILVHIANMPSFLGRTVYYGPADGVNLNRAYPGRVDGTQSERIAHVITSAVIARADFVADLHCGDANEALRPYSYWMRTGDEDVDRASRELAVAFGVDWIVIDDGRPRDPAASVFTANTALTRGIPAITTETGELGSVDERWVTMAERGAWNLLRHLGMVEDGSSEMRPVTWLAPTEVLRSPETGMFRAAVRPGDEVAEGALLGPLQDWFGDPVREIRAPFAGLVIYVVATPPVTAGEPLAMLGEVQAREGGEEADQSVDRTFSAS
jgi:predicted deacylase